MTNITQCQSCSKPTPNAVCDECLDPCRSITGNGPPVPSKIPVGICTYIDLDTGCVYFRDGCDGGFPTKACPPVSCAMPAKVATAATMLRGCEGDHQAYTLPSDSLVKNSQTHYTHVDAHGNPQDIYLPWMDFCFNDNENCPKDGHWFSSFCREGMSNFRWEFSESCQDFQPIPEGADAGSFATTMTACGGNVRFWADDPSGESWCVTKYVPPVCCAIIEGESATDGLSLFGGCFTVEPGFMCGYWFGDFAPISNPGVPNPPDARQIVLDNSDQNCPAIFTMQIETVGQQFAEVSQGGPGAEFFALDNDVKMQVRVNEVGDPWAQRKFLSMYSSNSGMNDGSGQAGPTENNTCRRYVSEQQLCKVPSRNYNDFGGDSGQSLQHDYRTQAAILSNVEVLMDACEVATFEVNPIMFWDQQDGGAGNNLYFERWHLSISAKVRREVCK